MCGICTVDGYALPAQCRPGVSPFNWLVVVEENACWWQVSCLVQECVNVIFYFSFICLFILSSYSQDRSLHCENKQEDDLCFQSEYNVNNGLVRVVPNWSGYFWSRLSILWSPIWNENKQDDDVCCQAYDTDTGFFCFIVAAQEKYNSFSLS